MRTTNPTNHPSHTSLAPAPLPRTRVPTVTPAPPSVIPAQAGTHSPPLRHPCAPPPSFLRRQEPIRPLSVTPAPPSVIPAPSSVIPAQAGTTQRAPPTNPTHPFPNSSLPPSRGEARWGVESHEPPHQSPHAPIAHTALPTLPRPLSLAPAPPSITPTPHRHPCAPLRHSCAGRNRAHHPSRLHTSTDGSRTLNPHRRPRSPLAPHQKRPTARASGG